ncbi:hypothetical protein N0V90_002721 [Kalmusia sp. IMI 367209]|nr:hypothetical protein N0V90_002721 [Kalmusia sp. IMI 367209]
MPDPNLAVSLLTAEEAELYMRIRHTAFAHDVNKIFYFNQHEPSQATLDSVTAGIADGVTKNSALYLKCVDTLTGTIIAGARWRHMRPADPNATHRTWDEVEADLTVPEPYAESHPEASRVFFEQFNEKKRKHMGTRPYWVLDTLVTHPEHHRRGAGRLLLQWGCERADEAGLEVYLEASEMGEPLYKRFGFEPVERIELDLRRWGGDEVIKWAVMVRPAKGATRSDA